MNYRRTRAIALAALVAGALLTVPPARAVSGDGTVLAFGDGGFHGSTDGAHLVSPLVAMAARPGGEGYWLAAGDGGIFAYNAPFFGSIGGTPLRQPIVGMAARPQGDGYWLVASDGGVFAFGSAPFHGSAASLPLNNRIVGMAATADGNGYWLIGADGGIFSYGNATFHGSMGGTPLNRPVVGMAGVPGGGGYWMVASDGGIFSFGTAQFKGSMGGTRLHAPVVGMAATPGGQGYWMVAADGGMFAFNAPFHGSGVGRIPAGKIVLGMAAARVGSAYWMVSGPVPPVRGPFGPTVRDLQQRLVDLGYWTPIDGAWSELTRQAIYAVQKTAGLPRTGSFGSAERRVLEEGLRPVPRSRSGYLVEIDKPRQILMVVRDGIPLWTFNTSTGNGERYRSGSGWATAHTPEGRFAIYRAVNGQDDGPLGSLWRPRYFTGGYAIHGSPSVPPYPASHGCARLTNAAMNFVWAANLMPIGTPVWVYR